MVEPILRVLTFFAVVILPGRVHSGANSGRRWGLRRIILLLLNTLTLRARKNDTVNMTAPYAATTWAV